MRIVASVMNSFMNLFRATISGKLPTDSYKMAFIVRTDINMGKGKVAAQCAHAAVECYRKALTNRSHRGMLNAWELTGQPKIVLKVSSAEKLMQLAKTANESGLITSIIRDAGRTQLAAGTISVLGIGPSAKDDLSRITSNLKLL